MHRFTIISCIFSLALFVGGVFAEEKSENPRVLLNTNAGDIVLELYPEDSPLSVDNFLEYVDSHFYDGTIFHRIVPGFVVQGGGMNFDNTRKETRAPIANESNNGLSNERGTLSMARTNHPHSATSQFYINLQDNPSLDAQGNRPGYAVFGKVVSGMSVVDDMAKQHRDEPTKMFQIVKAERVTDDSDGDGDDQEP